MAKRPRSKTAPTHVLTPKAQAARPRGRKKSPPSTPAPAPAAVEWVRSYEALGQIIGVHRASFPRFRRDHADAPAPRSNGDHDVHAWRKFFESHPEIQRKSLVAPETQSGLEIEKLRQQCRRLVFDNDVAEKKYLLATDVEQWLIKIIEGQKYLLSNKLKNELPPKLEGLRAQEIAARMEPVIHEICSLLRTLPEVPIPEQTTTHLYSSAPAPCPPPLNT